MNKYQYCFILLVVLFVYTAHGMAEQKSEATAAENQAAYLKAGKIPVPTFFKRPEFVQMVMSPDGQKLAARVPFKGRNNLVVIDLAKRTRQVITAFDSVDVADISWINNQRIFMRIADGQDVSGKFNYRGQWAINWDGTELYDLSRLRSSNMVTASTISYTKIIPLSRTYDDSADMIVLSNQRARDSDDVYRLNTKTGKFKLLSFDSPGRTHEWVLDRNLVPRVATRLEERKDKNSPQMATVWHRTGEDGKWEKIYEYPQRIGGDAFEPLAFDYDNRTLYVSSNVGRDKQAIFKFDTQTKKLGDLVFEHPLIDVEGGLLFSRSEKKLLGIRYSAEKPAVKWFDVEMENLQKQIDALFPGTLNTISIGDGDQKNMLIFAYSDTDPGMYHLFDREKLTIEPLVKQREWLSADLMSPRKFITYKTRDGVEIPAWLTIPKGSSGKNLPLVINIHGGPQVRGYGGVQWGLPEAQFFASRGYAVLEPEPRSSTGFGRKHDTLGHKQWGLAMQDDITDGALHLVKEGIVDKSRMCLFGGSYGGYATLQGMVKEPELFKCGVAYVAVSDLFLFQKVSWSDIAQQSDYLETDFIRLVGDSTIDKAQFELTSPARNADKIKGPIMIAMGAEDVRVPLIHGERMRDALEKAGKKHEWVVYSGEGHGFNKDENVFDFWSRVERFLGANLK